ncbi:MAG: ABC transporter ATP-binding protein [Hyphomicrobiales bacterium]|nr:MAG: ABC transporter ATP-binding protein [Hyphomicrobiales bacterium]
MSKPIIEIRGLSVEFKLRAGTVRALANVNFSIERGKTTCIVGESGSGKSVTTRSIMQLNRYGRIAQGDILYHGEDGATSNIATLAPNGSAMRSIRGKEIGIIFQEPMTALSPVHKIGEQIEEPISIHLKLPKQQAREMVLEIMAKVGIPNPVQRYDNYPYQLSGGLRQRAAIAMALACRPQLLIADEPTTALDVTTQANILDLIGGLQKDLGMTVMFITHDLGVVAEIADQVVVMYMGTVVETGDVDSIFHNPKHPYTRALLASVPRLSTDRTKPLPAIRGMVPHALARPSGCVFHTRCDQAVAGVCDKINPAPHDIKAGHTVRCVHYGNHAALDKEIAQ